MFANEFVKIGKWTRARHVCSQCGAFFNMKMSQHLAGSNETFCNRKCQWEWQSISEHHPRWNGGSYTNPNGYVTKTVSKNHQGRQAFRPRMLEHRYVMQNILARPLTSDETVHHKDGNKSNNDPSNLELRSKYHGEGATAYTADVNNLIEKLSRAEKRLVSEYEYLPNSTDC